MTKSIHESLNQRVVFTNPANNKSLIERYDEKGNAIVLFVVKDVSDTVWSTNPDTDKRFSLWEANDKSLVYKAAYEEVFDIKPPKLKGGITYDRALELCQGLVDRFITDEYDPEDSDDRETVEGKLEEIGFEGNEMTFFELTKWQRKKTLYTFRITCDEEICEAEQILNQCTDTFEYEDWEEKGSCFKDLSFEVEFDNEGNMAVDGNWSWACGTDVEVILDNIGSYLYDQERYFEYILQISAYEDEFDEGDVFNTHGMNVDYELIDTEEY